MESLVLQWIWDISGWLWTKNLQRPLNAFLFWKESISLLPKHCRRSGIAPSPLVWLIPQPSWKPKILTERVWLWKRKMWPKWSTRNSWRGRAPESSNLVCRSIEIDLKQERFVTYLLVEWKTIMKWCCPNTLLRQLPQHPSPRSIGHLGLSWSQEIWISPFIWDYLLFGDGAHPLFRKTSYHFSVYWHVRHGSKNSPTWCSEQNGNIWNAQYVKGTVYCWDPSPTICWPGVNKQFTTTDTSEHNTWTGSNIGPSARIPANTQSSVWR